MALEIPVAQRVPRRYDGRNTTGREINAVLDRLAQQFEALDCELSSLKFEVSARRGRWLLDFEKWRLLSSVRAGLRWGLFAYAIAAVATALTKPGWSQSLSALLFQWAWFPSADLQPFYGPVTVGLGCALALGLAAGAMRYYRLQPYFDDELEFSRTWLDQDMTSEEFEAVGWSDEGPCEDGGVDGLEALRSTKPPPVLRATR